MRFASILFVISVTLAACSSDEETPEPTCAADPDRVDPGQKLCDGLACTTSDQCVSNDCKDGTCAASANKTCGVGKPTACNDGEKCQQDLDCKTDFCAERVCAPRPANVHADGRRNGGETGVDCGGDANKPCPGGERCKSSDDCESTCGGGRCATPTATDGKKNQGESDVDCGGPNAPPCVRGKACTANADCQLQACTANVCAEPSGTDGLQNGAETDVDCGGPGVTEGDFSYRGAPCREGLVCAADSDCLTVACGPTSKRCALPSCATAETAGIETCGEGETPEAGKKHESCCRSLTLPTRTERRLDKYEITAGRYRSFITKVGPNIRGWVAKYVEEHPGSQLANLLAANGELGEIFPAQLNDDYMSLETHLALDLDNYDGVRGCYNGEGSFGANTYWQEAEVLARFGMPPRPLDRTVTDEKSLNCQMPIMLMAFCAWDGGELATIADIVDAWGPGYYPWGNDQIPRDSYNWCNGGAAGPGQPAGEGGFNCQCDGSPVVDGASGVDARPCNYAVNGLPGVFYEYPRGGLQPNDHSPLIAAPGRMLGDRSAIQSNGESWADLYGNLAEMLGDLYPGFTNFCSVSSGVQPGRPACDRADPSTGGRTPQGALYGNIPGVPLIGASWEGHVYRRQDLAGSRWISTAQYGKFGGRCVRPVE